MCVSLLKTILFFEIIKQENFLPVWLFHSSILFSSLCLRRLWSHQVGLYNLNKGKWGNRKVREEGGVEVFLDLINLFYKEEGGHFNPPIAFPPIKRRKEKNTPSHRLRYYTPFVL